jgi:hypothetical protein
MNKRIDNYLAWYKFLIKDDGKWHVGNICV